MSRWHGVAAVVCAATMAGACVTYNPTALVYEPKWAGVVAVEASRSHPAYTLEDGQAITVELGGWITGAAARTGDLMLGGDVPRPWAYAVRRTTGALSSNCYAVDGAAWDRDAAIDLLVRVNAQDAYLRLAKKTGFEPSTGADGRLLGGGSLCLDAGGQVVSQGS